MRAMMFDVVHALTNGSFSQIEEGAVKYGWGENWIVGSREK